MPSNPRMTIFCQYLPDGAEREQNEGIVAAAASATQDRCHRHDAQLHGSVDYSTAPARTR